jgi:hypothetical protein
MTRIALQRTPYHAGAPFPTCPLCDGHVTEGEPCAVCYAPYELILSASLRGEPPRFVGVLGPSGVGKTVYLGLLLELLARGVGGLRGLPVGPGSLAVQRDLVLALERQRFPEKTPNEADRWQWVCCEVTPLTGARRPPTFDLIAPDVAGEAVMAELERPRSNATVRALIGKCAGLVVLADVVQVIADGQGQELFAMQLVSYLAALHGAGGRRKVEVPVAVVFTKSDLCEEPIDDPDAFARANAAGLWNLCQARLKHHRFFRARAAGSTAILVDADGGERLVPLRIEPEGIVEPVAWLLSLFR